MRIKSPRRVPALLLGAGVAVAAALLAGGARARRPASAAEREDRLAALQRDAAEPGAPAAAWRDYARALQASDRPAHAAQAWQRARELDRFCAEAAEGRAVALAAADDADALFAHLEGLVLEDARLALRVLAHEAVARHAADPRYRPILAEARSQAVD